MFRWFRRRILGMLVLSDPAQRIWQGIDSPWDFGFFSIKLEDLTGKNITTHDGSMVLVYMLT
jgi:hypothetical protein